MERKILWVYLIVGVLLMSLVRADLTADIYIEADGNVKSDTHLSTDDGDINYNSYVDAEGDYISNTWTNGDATYHTTEHYDEQNNYRSGVSLSSLANWFSDTAEIIAFGETGHGRRSMQEEMLSIFNSMSLVFVTRPELQTTNENTLALHYRLEAVEKTLEKLHPEEYCESKLEVMRDYDLGGASCGEWEFSISGDDMIVGVKKVEPEPEDDIRYIEYDPEQDDNLDPWFDIPFIQPQWRVEAIAHWDIMCSQGMDKWCMIAEQNRREWGME